MHDVIIIGSGPAGITAGIFAVRRSLKALILSDPLELSLAEEATVVDDWPGDPEIRGIELVKRFREHAKRLGVEMKDEKDRVKELEKRIRQLESALADEHIKNAVLESLVEIARDKYGIDLKKKSGQAPSKEDTGE